MCMSGYDSTSATHISLQATSNIAWNIENRFSENTDQSIQIINTWQVFLKTSKRLESRFYNAWHWRKKLLCFCRVCHIYIQMYLNSFILQEIRLSKIVHSESVFFLLPIWFVLSSTSPDFQWCQKHNNIGKIENGYISLRCTFILFSFKAILF